MIEKIIAELAECMGTSVEEIKSESQCRDIVAMRQIVAFAVYAYARCSLSAVARQLNYKDHSSVIHAIKVVSEAIDRDNAMYQNYVAMIPYQYAVLIRADRYNATKLEKTNVVVRRTMSIPPLKNFTSIKFKAA